MAKLPPIVRMMYGTSTQADLALAIHHSLESWGVTCNHDHSLPGPVYVCDLVAKDLIESEVVSTSEDIIRILGETPAFKETLKQELAQAWDEGLELGMDSRGMDSKDLEVMNPFKSWEDFNAED